MCPDGVKGTQNFDPAMLAVANKLIEQLLSHVAMRAHRCLWHQMRGILVGIQVQPSADNIVTVH